jgi:hypothetical protein
MPKLQMILTVPTGLRLTMPLVGAQVRRLQAAHESARVDETLQSDSTLVWEASPRGQAKGYLML